MNIKRNIFFINSIDKKGVFSLLIIQILNKNKRKGNKIQKLKNKNKINKK